MSSGRKKALEPGADADLERAGLADETLVVVAGRVEVLLAEQVADTERERPVFRAAELRERNRAVHAPKISPTHIARSVS